MKMLLIYLGIAVTLLDGTVKKYPAANYVTMNDKEIFVMGTSSFFLESDDILARFPRHQVKKWEEI